ELLRWRSERVTGPLGAQLQGESLCCRIVATGEGEHPAPLVAGDLDDDVGGGAEAVEAEPLRIPGPPQGAVADEPGAEQGRRLQVGTAGGDGQAEAPVGDGLSGVAAVDLIAGEAGELAEVLAPAEAVAA